MLRVLPGRSDGASFFADVLVQLQGAELMGKHRINVPPGMAIQKIEDLLPAAKMMADSDGEVCETTLCSTDDLLVCSLACTA